MMESTRELPSYTINRDLDGHCNRRHNQAVDIELTSELAKPMSGIIIVGPHIRATRAISFSVVFA